MQALVRGFICHLKIVQSCNMFPLRFNNRIRRKSQIKGALENKPSESVKGWQNTIMLFI